MNKLWVIARKDIREAFKSRSTYVYIVIMIVLSFSYLSTYNALISTLKNQHDTQQQIRDASLFFLNNIAYTLPMMYSVLVCTIFATYSVVVDKAKRNLESLMATPLSLKQIWRGKSLAVTLPSVVLGLAVSVLGYCIINYVAVIRETGSFIFPEALAIATAIIIVPILVFTVVTIVLYLQLVISNPRVANFVFTVIFLLLFFGANFLGLLGIPVSLAYIYLGIIIICGGISYLLSHSLTKEKVLLSNKG